MTSPHFEQRTADTFDGWLTPEWVLDLVREFGPIGLDPCTEESNPTGAQHFYTEHGLHVSWHDQGNVWVNSPYGHALSKWAAKTCREAEYIGGASMFSLTPARPETLWFGQLWDTADACAFFRKRIKFWHPSKPNAKQPAFPNAMFYFGPFNDRFRSIFEPSARVVTLRDFNTKRRLA